MLFLVMSETKRKILVVDDEANFADLVQMNLEKRGFDVKTLNKPLDVMTVAREYKPDLILLDYIMPKMSGDEVLKNLKRQPELIKTPVVFVSAIATPKAQDGDLAVAIAWQRGQTRSQTREGFTPYGRTDVSDHHAF